MSTAVANAKETAVSTDVMDDIFEFAGEGTSFDSSEMQIPFIRLLQPLSPQLNKKKAEYIEGASSSDDAFNNVTSQHWDGEKGIKCYCLASKPPSIWSSYLLTPAVGSSGEINPASHMLQQTSRAGVPSEILPNGNELVKSDQHFCLVVEEDGSVSACCDRHEVDTAQDQPPLEDADRDAEGQKPEDWPDGHASCVRHDVAVCTLRRGVQ
jgi:hypothetical protein